jgi:hypothetical protein
LEIVHSIGPPAAERIGFYPAEMVPVTLVSFKLDRHSARLHPIVPALNVDELRKSAADCKQASVVAQHDTSLWCPSRSW